VQIKMIIGKNKKCRKIACSARRAVEVEEKIVTPSTGPSALRV
jgi:hypothetical protein